MILDNYDTLIGRSILFVHIPKTGGTSCAALLRQIADRVLVPHRHATLSDITPDPEHLILCTMREPIERLISWYKHCQTYMLTQCSLTQFIAAASEQIYARENWIWRAQRSYVDDRALVLPTERIDDMADHFGIGRIRHHRSEDLWPTSLTSEQESNLRLRLAPDIAWRSQVLNGHCAR